MIEFPDSDELRRRIRANRKPVIVRGAMQRWPGMSNWTLDYLREKIGADQEVAVSVSPNRVFHMDPARGFRVERMTFEHYLEHVLGMETPKEHYYLAQASIPEKFPALRDDFEIPQSIKNRLLSINLWLGKEGTITPLHHDAGDNFLSQIQGLKEVVLYSVDDLPNFYPNPLMDVWSSRMIPTDSVNPDLAKYPAIAKAQPFECTLRKGEMLFIPAGWWHQVRILELSVSVNFWWIAPWSFYLSRPGMHVAPLALLSARNLLRKLCGRSARSSPMRIPIR